MNRLFRDGGFFQNYHLRKGLFTPEECNQVIKLYKTKTAQTATVVDTEKLAHNSVPSVPRNDVRQGKLVYIDKSANELNFVFDRLYNAVIWANFGWSLLPLEFIQITEYNPVSGGFYKRHRDVISNQIPQRIISCVIQLSDPKDYEGCELVFDETSGLPTPSEFVEQGDTIFFLADEPHEVKPITSGTRFSLVGWFTGPVFWGTSNLPKYF